MSTAQITTFDITPANTQSGKARTTSPWSLLLRISLSALLLGVLFWRIDRDQLAIAMRAMRWDGWLLAALILLLSQFASSLRWAGLASAVGFMQSQREFVRLYFSGMFFSLCLPSSIGGDVLKAYWLAPSLQGRLLAGCTVLADRLAGLVAIVLIGSTAFVYSQYELTAWQLGLLAAGFIMTSMIAGWILMRLIGRLANASSNARTDTPSAARQFVDRLLPYCHRPVVFGRAVVWSLLVQGLTLLGVAAIGYSLGLRLPFEAYAISVPVVALLTVVPVSVSGLGVREGGLAWLLAGHGVDETYSVAIGLLWFAAAAANGLIGGAVYLVCKRTTAEDPLSIAM